jgi:hypothetical protein
MGSDPYYDLVSNCIFRIGLNNSIVSAIPIAVTVGVPKIAGATVAALIIIANSLNYLRSEYQWANF